MNEKIFWLHIKKSAGTTVRSLLQPYYVEVDRAKKPKSFIQATPEEYNDILNNYRVVLGEYQFKRCLFAKKYLYPESWEQLYSFAFSREPVDRCQSMFFYLFWKDPRSFQGMIKNLKLMVNTQKLIFNTSYAFDVFLDFVQEARTSDSIYKPLDSHFTTHTATMHDDITDLEGNVLIKRVFRVESLAESINQVFEECNIDKIIQSEKLEMNKTKNKIQYTPSISQIKKIKKIYSHDFEIYENALC